MAAIALAAAGRGERWAAFLPLVLLLAVVFLKGTSPGGQREWEEFQAAKDR